MEHSLSVVSEAVDEFLTCIKTKYRERQIGDEDVLLRCKSEKLVRLEVVETVRMPAPEQRGSRGKGKDVRTPLAYADIFKVESGKKPVRKVLVDGDAGIGKTTFCTAISEKWANGEILKEFDMVLLLPLREPEIASAGSLFDLLNFLHPSKKMCKLVEEYLEMGNKSVLVIADGWDELGENERKFLSGFLFGSRYHSISTLVTSRPSASASIHLHRNYIDRFTVIRGFSKERAVEFINSEFASDQNKGTELIHKIESNPLVESMCSVPLNCVIICHLWQTSEEEFPTTITGIYTKVILSIILRNIHKLPDHENILTLSSFDDIPDELQQSWWSLCKFACEALEKDQLVFSDKELKGYFGPGESLRDRILCFGLLQSSLSCLAIGCGRSFHFLHLTFQEYLAALYQVKRESELPAESDHSPLKSILATVVTVNQNQNYKWDTETKYQIIYRFFFGIAFAVEAFKNSVGCRIQKSFDPGSYYSKYTNLDICHWAFESQDREFTCKVAKQVTRDVRYPEPKTPHDFAVIVYIMDSVQEQSDVILALVGCCVRDIHLRKLTDVLAKKNGKLQVCVLFLDDNLLTDKGVEDLFHRASAAFESLEDLDLGYNNISGESINSVLAVLAKPFNKCPEVSFNFSRIPVTVSSLRVLRDSLSHHQLSHLLKLDLSGSLSSDADANADFVRTLGHCRSLKELNISWNPLRAPGGRALGKLLSQVTLQYLNASRVQLSDEGMAALGQGLKSRCHVGRLDLKENDISAAGISYFANSILTGQSIVIGSLHLNRNPLGLEGTRALVKLLSIEHFMIYDLSLGRCSLAIVEDPPHTVSRPDEVLTCVGIKEWIRSNGMIASHIEKLDLSNNNFTGEGIHVLAGFMRLCPQLLRLACGRCKITSTGLQLFMRLVSGLTLNLANWSLRSNCIDDDGVSALLENLSTLPSLTNIDFDFCERVSPDVRQKLNEICETRRQEMLNDDCNGSDSDSDSADDFDDVCSYSDSDDDSDDDSDHNPDSDSDDDSDNICMCTCMLSDDCNGSDSVSDDDSDDDSDHNPDSDSDDDSDNICNYSDSDADGDADDNATRMHSSGVMISAQHSMPNSMEPTSLEPHPIQQEVAAAIVTKRDRKNIDSSENKEFCCASPSMPLAKRIKLREDDNEHWSLGGRVTEENHTSSEPLSLQHTTIEALQLAAATERHSNDSEDYATPLPSQSTNRVNLQEDENEAHPIVDPGRSGTPVRPEHLWTSGDPGHSRTPVDPERSGTPLTESNIISALDEVIDPFRLGIHLGIKPHELKKIEKENTDDVRRQMAEVIIYWLQDDEHHSWEILANAVKKMGGHGNLVRKLRAKHSH